MPVAGVPVVTPDEGVLPVVTPDEDVLPVVTPDEGVLPVVTPDEGVLPLVMLMPVCYQFGLLLHLRLANSSCTYKVEKNLVSMDSK